MTVSVALVLQEAAFHHRQRNLPLGANSGAGLLGGRHVLLAQLQGRQTVHQCHIRNIPHKEVIQHVEHSVVGDATDHKVLTYQQGGALTINNGSFTYNSAGHGSGGAIYANGGILNLTDVSFANNSAHNSGGAIYTTAGATLTYTVTSGKEISNTGNTGGFLYMGAASDKATFDIAKDAKLTIGDDSGNDSFRSYGGGSIIKSGDGYMLINSTVDDYLTWTVAGGILELGRIKRTIDLTDYTIGVGAMLKLSSLNDTVNMSTDKNIGILDLGGGSDTINTGGYSLSGGELRISTLTFTGGGRVSSEIITRDANAGFNITLANVQLESNITGHIVICLFLCRVLHNEQNKCQ